MYRSKVQFHVVVSLVVKKLHYKCLVNLSLHVEVVAYVQVVMMLQMLGNKIPTYTVAH